MSLLLQKHPEILHFQQERFSLDPAIEHFIHALKIQFPSQHRALQTWRQTFSSQKVWTPVAYTQAGNTRMQETFARTQDIIYMQGIKPGKILDISNIFPQEALQEVRHFAQEIQALSLPEPRERDITSIGKLPLLTLHNADSKDFYDPLIGKKLQSVQTLDVSFHPGKSIKDIMAKQMIDDALKSGDLHRNTPIIEATSGNTGAGLAIVAASYGMKTVFTIPNKMSPEKITRLQFLGAHIVITPTKVSADHPMSYYSIRDTLAEYLGGWKANQYHNLSNRNAHEHITGPHIWEQTGGDISTVIIAGGTGGTISGIGRFLKKKNPSIRIISIDPVGSILYLLKEGYGITEVEQYAKGYLLQGFGEDILPKNFDMSVIDEFIRVSDREGMLLTQYLPSLGVFAGQSSGAVYAGLIKLLAKGKLASHEKVFVIFPDTALPYRSDTFHAEWIEKQGLENL